MHFIIRDTLFTHIDNLTQSSSYYTHTEKNSFRTIASCIFVMALCSIILTYQAVEDNFPVPLDWQVRLQTKCNVPVSYEMKFNTASFVQAGAFALFYSGYIGCISYGDSQLQDELSFIPRTIITTLLTSVVAYPYLELA